MNKLIGILLVTAAFYTLFLFPVSTLAQGNYSLEGSFTPSANQQNGSPTTLQSETKKLTPLSEPTINIDDPSYPNPDTPENKKSNATSPASSFNCQFPLSTCSGVIYIFLFIFLVLIIFVIYRKYRTQK